MEEEPWETMIYQINYSLCYMSYEIPCEVALPHICRLTSCHFPPHWSLCLRNAASFVVSGISSYCLLSTSISNTICLMEREFLLPILPLPKLFYMLKPISTFLSPPKILFPLWSLHSLLNPLLLQCCLISWLNFNYCSYQYCTISLHIVSYLKMLRFWRCSCFEKFGY
jgi:hypothetical protein